MNIKTILVHVAGDDQAEKRLDVALDLAVKFDAHITAIYIPRPLIEGNFGRGASAAYKAEMERLAEGRAQEAEARFVQACADHGVSRRWVMEDGEHADVLERHARVGDLMVLSQSKRKNIEDYVSKQLTEELVMVSGVPVLAVPTEWEARETGAAHLGKTIMVAWKSTRECVRALRDALPFLAVADKVYLMAIGDSTEDGSLAPDQAVMYLKRHGIVAEVRQDFDGNTDVGDVLLKQQAALGADLLVMGAYGRPTWRKMVFGGATEHVMHNMTTPVLMSH